MNKYYLGIDIGGTEVKLGLIDSNHALLHKTSSSVCFDYYETPIINTVVTVSDLFLKKYNITPDMLYGIGVSATGQIDNKNGIVVGSAGHIKNWLHTPIKKILEEYYNTNVFVENDANCALLGEQFIGNCGAHTNVILVTIGTGVGGGILINNKLLSGSIGIAGEVGHFPINKDGTVCSCGNTGCFEVYGSMTSLVKKVKTSNIFNDTDVNGRLIFQHLGNGNEHNSPYLYTNEYTRVNHELKLLVDEWISDIASGLIGLIHIFNPSLIIIGGGVSEQHELFLNPLKEIILTKAMRNYVSHLEILPAKCGNDAGILGAVSLII